MRRLAWAIAAAAILLPVTPSVARAATARNVLVVLIPADGSTSSMLGRFRAFPRLTSIALMTASVGRYNEQQTLLDITQGARVPRLDYSPAAPPQLSVTAGGVVREWPAVLRRARSADASIEPGLLASEIPGGAAYATAGETAGRDAILAADRDGRVAAISLGSAASLPARVVQLTAAHALVVVDLSGDSTGVLDLVVLLGIRRPGELVLALERPPPSSPRAVHAPLLLALAAAGIAGRPGALTTATTRTDGLVTATDLGPTILGWLHLRGPSQFIGQPIHGGAPRSVASLASFARRLSVIAGRRSTVILAFLAAWLALLGAALLLKRALRRSLRIGGLTALWTPSTVLLGAALEPSAWVETVVVVGVALVLALACDRLLGWPRAMVVPAFAALVLYTADLALGSQLIELSLLGSNPIGGSRFFGVGNELAAVLPVVLLAGLAAALPQRPLARREIAVVATGGAVLTLIVAWGRLGANIGGVFTVGGGTAFAVLVLLPGGLSWRRVGVSLLVLLLALGVVSLLDLATGGGAHFTRQVLHAHSLSALAATLGRRLSEAWAALFTRAMALAALVCAVAVAVVVRHRRQVLAPAGPANSWAACLGGGLGGSLLGSIANDSGLRLLLVGCFTLACVLGYLWGAPQREAVRAD